MSRNRTIPADFWTWEAVVDCAPMARLLFLGLWTFADDFGVQPLRPRTIRMQVFPGEAIDGDAVRAMIEELAARGLVRPYSVGGQDYIAIVDWHRLQRVGKRARHRFPDISEMDQGPARSAPAADTIADHRNRPPVSQAEDIADHRSPPAPSGAEDIADHRSPPATSGAEGIADHRSPPAPSGAEGIADHRNPPSTCGKDWQAVGTLRAPSPAAASAVLP